MIKTHNSTFTPKNCIHYSDNNNSNLFKRVIVCCFTKPRKFLLRPLVKQKDIFQGLEKKLSVRDCLNLRLLNSKFSILITKMLLHIGTLRLSYNELLDANNIKASFARQNKIKIDLIGVDADEEAEYLVKFIQDSDNKGTIEKIQSIEISTPVHVDNEDAIQELINLLPSLPNLNLFSLLETWVPLEFPAMPNPISLHLLKVLAPIDLGKTSTINVLRFGKISAPVTFPKELPCISSISYDEIVECPEVQGEVDKFIAEIKVKTEEATENQD